MASGDDTPTTSGDDTPTTSGSPGGGGDAAFPRSARCLGRCKWFDEKKGYGFIVVCDGEQAGADVFVHYKDVSPQSSSRRSLRKGEYVHMQLEVRAGDRPQAAAVTGVNGGPLMCDHQARRSPAAAEPDAPLRVQVRGGA